jgi:tRNA (cytidine32/uridine32-2'-O)-methyltransferase
MDLDRVDVVLLRPARPANVAAACRAMKNMGLNSLLLVGFAAEEVDDDARALAYGAWDVLDAARSFPDLPSATADAHFVAGTSGRGAPGTWTPRALAVEAGERVGSGRLAIVFGPEASGLSDVELALCHARVHIPCHPAQPSLNLAQAVLVVAYELFLAAGADAVVADVPQRAPSGELEAALADLRAGLLDIGYLNQENPGPILAELRGLLARAGPTPRDVTLLRGLARQMRWAARVAKGRTGSG